MNRTHQYRTFIVVEGIDGAGKSTLVRRLTDHFEIKGYPVTRISRYMIPELTRLWHHLVEHDTVDQIGAATLAVADYFVGLERCIRPALDEGQVVLADRSYYSHIVHFALRGVPLDLLRTQFRQAQPPDLLLYVAISPNAALARLRPKHKPDFWESGLDYRLGLSIGQAYRLYQHNPLSRQIVEKHFLEHQANALDLFTQILPQHVTCHLNGDHPQKELGRQAIQEVERLFAERTYDS